jgi:mRNA-degrading endonuclease YafQ of YafQ-DinJ toxin-antitoxin module
MKIKNIFKKSEKKVAKVQIIEKQQLEKIVGGLAATPVKENAGTKALDGNPTV